MKVVIEGERELIKSLRALEKDLPKELSKIHKAAIAPVADAAASAAPTRSGRLAGSVRAMGSIRTGSVAAGRSSIPYAGVIHYGWPGRNIEPQPFLQDALDANGERVVDIYMEELDRFIDSVWETIQ